MPGERDEGLKSLAADFLAGDFQHAAAGVDADDMALEARKLRQDKRNATRAGSHIQDERVSLWREALEQGLADQRDIRHVVELLDAVVAAGVDIVEQDDGAPAQIDAFGLDEQPPDQEGSQGKKQDSDKRRHG